MNSICKKVQKHPLLHLWASWYGNGYGYNIQNHYQLSFYGNARIFELKIQNCQLELKFSHVNHFPLRRGALNTTLCDKVCHWLAPGRWFSLVSSNNKIYCHDIQVAEILLKVAVNTISLTRNHFVFRQDDPNDDENNEVAKKIVF